MTRLLICLACTCAFAVTAAAHVLDQYLQVAQIGIAPDGARVELRLTPGAQVADRVLALIDADGDGKISPTEEQSYARRVLQDVTFEVDGRRASLALVSLQFPPRHEIIEGIGAIRLTLAAEVALGAPGDHQLSFRNDHLPEFSAYLANALVPATNKIKITGQQRDALQHGLQINYQATSDVMYGRLFGACLLLFLLCVALSFRRLRFGNSSLVSL